MKTLVYAFPSALFERDEAHDWVFLERYRDKLQELVTDGRVKVYSIGELCNSCNNRDIANIWEYWLVCTSGKDTVKKR